MREFVDLRSDHRLSAGYYHMGCAVAVHFRGDGLDIPLLAFRLPGSVGRVAPGAAQVAAAGAHKNGRNTSQHALALNGIKNFSYFHEYNRVDPGAPLRGIL